MKPEVGQAYCTQVNKAPEMGKTKYQNAYRPTELTIKKHILNYTDI